jgi:hypothetical protein
VSIAEKRERLQQPMAQLRAARLKSSEVEQERSAKKQTYDTLQMQLQSEESTIRTAVTQLRDEVQQMESEYIRASLKMDALHGTAGKVRGTIRPPEPYKTFREMYEKKDPELRQAQNALREQKKESGVCPTPLLFLFCILPFFSSLFVSRTSSNRVGSSWTSTASSRACCRRNRRPC